MKFPLLSEAKDTGGPGFLSAAQFPIRSDAASAWTSLCFSSCVVSQCYGNRNVFICDPLFIHTVVDFSWFDFDTFCSLCVFI